LVGEDAVEPGTFRINQRRRWSGRPPAGAQGCSARGRKLKNRANTPEPHVRVVRGQKERGLQVLKSTLSPGTRQVGHRQARLSDQIPLRAQAKRRGAMFRLSPALWRGPILNPVVASNGSFMESSNGLCALLARSWSVAALPTDSAEGVACCACDDPPSTVPSSSTDSMRAGGAEDSMVLTNWGYQASEIRD
jgi:hypothetical protein